MMFIQTSADLSPFEIIEKLSTIIIAACTLVLSFYIYYYQLKKDNKNLKLDWYKVIIIESKFEDFFNFFEGLNLTLIPMKNNPNLSVNDKERINTAMVNSLIELRLDFITLLLSVDDMLYQCVLTQFDELVDGITTKLSNEDLNLNDPEIYDEEISKHISQYRTQLLKIFVEFRGDNDSYKRLIKRVKDYFNW
ncbi:MULTISPECIES: hypothetical protein [Flavobacteriaceae]|uniref:DUF4760 domain-containing protein n=2 Tax=Flavobacteriaceae TaxID=49546 RepID=A0A4Y8AUH3_9FLAO|nr:MULTISPECIES: hypothetical protein [Flavobacteriaceae]TEW75133.1 hypothetical protein E2488_06315 [Gramella jeungdoensis]GGK41307.1 hypothetical protein GCM10007963_06670 [Lutibacter litoralis]